MAAMVAPRVASPTPTTVSIPAARSIAWPCPATRGLGSSMAETTRREAGLNDGVRARAA